MPFFATTRPRAPACLRLFVTPSSARAWPISSECVATISHTSGAASSSRSRFDTAARERPMASAHCWCVSWNSLMSRSSARASSSEFRFSRWMFSMSATAIAASSGMWRMIAGMSGEARELRGAPATLARDDLVTLRLARRRRADRPHDDGLHDALRLDGVRQLLQRLLPHVEARLILATLKQVERQFRELVAGRERGILRARRRAGRAPAPAGRLRLARSRCYGSSAARLRPSVGFFWDIGRDHSEVAGAADEALDRRRGSKSPRSQAGGQRERLGRHGARRRRSDSRRSAGFAALLLPA